MFSEREACPQHDMHDVTKAALDLVAVVRATGERMPMGHVIDVFKGSLAQVTGPPN